MKIPANYTAELRAIFAKGFEARSEEIREMGFIAARDKFNMDYPVPYKPSSPEAMAFCSGEFEALFCNSGKQA